MKSKVLFSALFLMFLLLTLRLEAWWPIGHYEITKKAGYPEIAKYAQLPDYEEAWKVFQWGIWWFEVMDITYGFCWSHGVQDAGDIWGGLCPLKPYYPNDGRYPGPIMWDLVQKKLKNLTTSEKTEMEKVAKGFIAHNAADNNVHWQYFLGATGSEPTPWDSGAQWTTHHLDKERWSDYWIYIKNHFDGNPDNAFDKKGNLILVNEYQNGLPLAKPSNEMVEIMRLTQKVYRKNRRATEKSDEYDEFSVQGVATIKKLIKTTIVAENTANKMKSTYNKNDFENLETLANSNSNNWYPDDLYYQYYLPAVDNVKAWMQAYCN